MYRFRFIRAVFCGALVLLCASNCWGWGKEGHRLTALVADHYLTPEAQAQIKELLKGKSLEDVASWADEYKQGHAETAPWHFVDIPANAKEFDRDRDCPKSPDAKSPWRDCVTDRILYFEGRLGDTTLPAAERADALKFLVHFIGDVHQPFHALGDARGGNDISVVFLGSQQCESYHCNLHGVWDDSMIEEHGLNEAKYTDLLLKEIEDNHWEKLAGGSPVAWANISHEYAQKALVQNGAMIQRDYYKDQIRVVDSQLALGGLRLAHVLNRILVAPERGPEQKELPKPAR